MNDDMPEVTVVETQLTMDAPFREVADMVMHRLLCENCIEQYGPICEFSLAVNVDGDECLLVFNAQLIPRDGVTLRNQFRHDGMVN
jgi:hypothetical protein